MQPRFPKLPIIVPLEHALPKIYKVFSRFVPSLEVHMVEFQQNFPRGQGIMFMRPSETAISTYKDFSYYRSIAKNRESYQFEEEEEKKVRDVFWKMRVQRFGLAFSWIFAKTVDYYLRQPNHFFSFKNDVVLTSALSTGKATVLPSMNPGVVLSSDHNVLQVLIRNSELGILPPAYDHFLQPQVIDNKPHLENVWGTISTRAQKIFHFDFAAMQRNLAGDPRYDEQSGFPTAYVFEGAESPIGDVVKHCMNLRSLTLQQQDEIFNEVCQKDESMADVKDMLEQVQDYIDPLFLHRKEAADEAIQRQTRPKSRKEALQS